MQAVIIYNPSGGQVVVRRGLGDVVDFLNRQGWNVALQETTCPMEATDLARRAVSEGAGVVIAAGGDGTVNEVANGLVNTGAALGVLPMGTTNVWALQMGIPALNPMLPGMQIVRWVADLEERIKRPMPANYYRKILLDAAQVLVEGQTVAIDVGELSGRYFMMWAGIGLDAAVMESLSPKDKKQLGSWAYLVQAIASGFRYPGVDIRLHLDGKLVETNSALVVVSNIQLYGGIMVIGARALVNDGKLDVCIFKGDGFITLAQHALTVLSHRHLRNPKVEYYQCSEITVESMSPMPVHVDGEVFTETPVSIRTIPAALKVIVPKTAPNNLFGQ